MNSINSIYDLEKRTKEKLFLSRLGEAASDLTVFQPTHSIGDAIDRIQERLLDAVPRSNLDVMICNAQQDARKQIAKNYPFLIRICPILSRQGQQLRRFTRLASKTLLDVDMTPQLKRSSITCIREHLLEILTMSALLIQSQTTNRHGVLMEIAERTLEGYLIVDIVSKEGSPKFLAY